MHLQARSLASVWACLAVLMVSLLISGCTTLKVVADYDEQIDKGVTQLQKDVETFLVKLEATAARDADPVAPYRDNTQFYQDAQVAVSGLRVRADAMERNSITVRMLDRIARNLGRLEDMHKEGLNRAEIEQSLRGALNAQFTAVLTFELAKKRGEKIDATKALIPSTPKPSTQGADQ